jgi:hypothetical protein
MKQILPVCHALDWYGGKHSDGTIDGTAAT